MHSSDYWSVQAGNKSPSKTHRAGYHTNHSIWTQQIAGFGCERASQIPSLISKRPLKTINTHTPPTLRPTPSNTHCLPFTIQRTRQRQEGWTCISFFACLRKGWASARQSACRGYSLMPPRAFTPLSPERMERKKEKGKSLPIYYSWRGDFPFRAPLSKPFPTRHPLYQPWQVPIKGLESRFFGETLEDFRDNSQWVHSGGGLETMVTWLHYQCVVLWGGNDPCLVHD